ncbi:MAG: response regulator [Alphaproteobacteria bacterium]|nr:response regulator [Alphaproteobacteria bacterium]
MIGNEALTDDFQNVRLRRLLLVEDSSTAAMMVKSVFSIIQGPVNFEEVVHVTTLAAAVAFLASEAGGTVDAVLLDLTMPDSSGLDTLERLRTLFPRPPIVVLTATSDESIGLRALALGAQDYLVKDETYPRLLKRATGYAVQRMRHETNLRAAKEKAEEATALKDKFVALVAHDLRGPLGAINGLVELLMMDKATPLNDRHRDTLTYVLNGGRSLLSVVEELLDISRLQTGKVTPEPTFFDGSFLVESVMDRLRQLADAKEVMLANEVAPQTRLFADRGLFSQVIQNLLSNAIKFSREGQTVRIFTPPDRPSTIAVADQGVGIPPTSVPKLFRLDEKVSTEGTAGEKGTGFGLPLSNNIMLAHGGEIGVVSEQGQGSVFLASLPVVQPRVLLVDDEPMMRRMMAGHLLSIGVDVVEAADGGMALAILEKEPPPHLIVSDIVMPMMDGFGLLRAVKENDRLKRLPVIVITGDERMETRDQAIRMGAADFSVKPIVAHDFIPRVRRYVG